MDLNFIFKSVSLSSKISNKPRTIHNELNSIDNAMQILKARRNLYEASNYKQICIATTSLNMKSKSLHHYKINMTVKIDHSSWYIRYTRGFPNLIHKN